MEVSKLMAKCLETFGVEADHTWTHALNSGGIGYTGF